MDIGPNVKRLREMDVAGSLRACVVAGPGDLMTWDVTVTIDQAGLKVDVIGRGSDIEAAASEAIAVLSRDGVALGRPMTTWRRSLPTAGRPSRAGPCPRPPARDLEGWRSRRTGDAVWRRRGAGGGT